MKAIIITQPGGPEVLQLAERPQPVPAADEVLIKVMAAGINSPDVKQRKGFYPPPPDAPQDIPGLEVAGIIVGTGDQVTRWKIGDEVCALLKGGGYAEYCTTPGVQCLPKPVYLSFEEAASLPETFFTVWSNVFDRGRLQPGESLLVHGGGGGIGVTAIQMARAMGSKVYATAGTDEKCRFCEALGATKCINYKKEDFAAVIKQVDVILDTVGSEYVQRNLQSLAVDGRLVLINAVKGNEVPIDLSWIMIKRLTITGSTLRPRDSGFKGKIAAALEEHIWPLLEAGLIKPVVYKVFPFQEAAQSHQLMESSQHTGKIILSFSI